MGVRPAWQPYYGEFWPWHANRFRPRIASTGRPHGFTEMEALLDDVLRRERVLDLKTAFTRPTGASR
jgi:hypothetical protein